MVDELAPLHHHHGELVRVLGVVSMDEPTDHPGVGQRSVGD